MHLILVREPRLFLGGLQAVAVRPCNEASPSFIGDRALLLQALRQKR
jgi:hypothetical protein